MKALRITKTYHVKDPQLICKAGGLIKKKGYIGEVTCSSTMKVIKLEEIWEARYPDPFGGCGGGDRFKSPMCAQVAPGAPHPGVVMYSDRSYMLNINIP